MEEPAPKRVRIDNSAVSHDSDIDEDDFYSETGSPVKNPPETYDPQPTSTKSEDISLDTAQDILDEGSNAIPGLTTPSVITTPIIPVPPSSEDIVSVREVEKLPIEVIQSGDYNSGDDGDDDKDDDRNDDKDDQRNDNDIIEQMSEILGANTNTIPAQTTTELVIAAVSTRSSDTSDSDSSEMLESSESEEEEEDGVIGESEPLVDAQEQVRRFMAELEDEKPVNEPPKTENEEEESYPPIPDVKLTPQMSITFVGFVDKILKNQIVIKGQSVGETVLQLGSLLCLQDRRIIGVTADTLGPVRSPLYTVGFLNISEMESFGLQLKTPIFYVNDHSEMVFTKPLEKLKGTDASNLYDEERKDEEAEFSDDEKERQFKKQKKFKEPPKGPKDPNRNKKIMSQIREQRRQAHPDRALQQSSSVVMNYDDGDDGGVEEGYQPLKRPENLQQLMNSGSRPPVPQPQPPQRRQNDKFNKNNRNGARGFQFGGGGRGGKFQNKNNDPRSRTQSPASIRSSGTDKGRFNKDRHYQQPSNNQQYSNSSRRSTSRQYEAGTTEDESGGGYEPPSSFEARPSPAPPPQQSNSQFDPSYLGPAWAALQGLFNNVSGGTSSIGQHGISHQQQQLQLQQLQQMLQQTPAQPQQQYQAFNAQIVNSLFGQQNQQQHQQPLSGLPPPQQHQPAQSSVAHNQYSSYGYPNSQTSNHQIAQPQVNIDHESREAQERLQSLMESLRRQGSR